MVGARRDSRSESQDLGEESGSEYHNADGTQDHSAPGKPGRKKNPNSQAARRDQNRIAQREFRLRKQQKIRDLEARLEILSGTQGETFSELREIIKDLMAENVTLRNLVRGLSGFIGEGTGGLVPKLGFARPQDFVEFVNRAETDTAFEGFQRRKKEAQGSQNTDTHGGARSSSGQKRTADEDDEPTSKRTKTSSGMGSFESNGKGSVDSERYSSMMSPITTTTPQSNFYSSTGRSSNDAGLFTKLLDGQNAGSTLYMNNASSDSSQHIYGSSNSSAPFPGVYQPPVNSVQSSFSNQPFFPNSTVPLQSPVDDIDDGPEDPKASEANKLIHYHLDNYKRNNAYCLPQSLRPTLVQRTVPHEGIIDGVVYPELRDRMILLRAQIDLVDCLHDLRKSVTLHGDDVLAHSNWELSEKWLRRYGFLVDQPVLTICNRWRRERGETELPLSEINPTSARDASSN
ncbi:hypothetical protein BD410DRAFT_779642 [Rickenella mellea]|uniref:BZIP domain-containing protein n=1 Tax=Rickenella mellea TaxID=50990 RepID=A0A4R5XDZ6_9AGAM|nr:hypothetical protein BD410DRAFT_779642 [Rickenella mellea]